MSNMSVNKPRSDVWNYFDKGPNCNAICTICKKHISYKSTITNLKGHLKRKHISTFTGISLNQASQPENRPIDQDLNIPGPSTSAVAFVDETQTGNVYPSPAPKRQRTIGLFVPRKITPDQKKKIDNDLLQLFILDFQPFSLVEDAG